MTTLTTVLRSGGRYTPDWVAALAAGARRHVAGIERIRCLCDVPIDIPGVEHVALRHDWPAWWSKIEAFRPDLADRTTILCDLDTVFMKDAPELTQTGELTVLEDFFLKRRTSSALMRWHGDDLAFVFERFAADPERWMKEGSCGAVPNSVHGDQVVIDHFLRREGIVPAFWQERYAGLIDFHDPAKADPGPVVVFIGPDKPDTATGPVAEAWSRDASR